MKTGALLEETILREHLNIELLGFRQTFILREHESQVICDGVTPYNALGFFCSFDERVFGVDGCPLFLPLPCIPV